MAKGIKFTTKHLGYALVKALRHGSIAEKNATARVGAVLLAKKQMELNERAHTSTADVTLFEIGGEEVAEMEALTSAQSV